MFRSRMPYTRWHARKGGLNEQIKQSVPARFFKLYSHLSSSEESSLSSVDRKDDNDDNTIDNEEQVHLFECNIDKINKGIRKSQEQYKQSKKIRAFGMQSERFPSSKEILGVPPPGTYTTKLLEKNYQTSPLPYEQQPFTKAPISVRQLANNVHHIGPGVYDVLSYLNKSTAIPSKGRFDTSSEVRCGPIKSGYLTLMQNRLNGPRFTDFPTNIDLLDTRHNKFKGKFLKCERVPRRMHERIFISVPSANPPDLNNQVCPNSYNPVNPNFKKSEFNVKHVPFLKSAQRMTKREYNLFIKNLTPFTGPGRYKYPKEDEIFKMNGFQYLFNSSKNNDRSMNKQLQSKLKHLLRPVNIPPEEIDRPIVPDRKGSQSIRPFLKLG